MNVNEVPRFLRPVTASDAGAARVPRRSGSPGIAPNEYSGTAAVNAPWQPGEAAAGRAAQGVAPLVGTQVVTIEQGQPKTWALVRRPQAAGLAAALDDEQQQIVDEVWAALSRGQGIPLNAEPLPDGSEKREYGVSTPDYLKEVMSAGLSLPAGESAHQYQVVVHARQERVLSLAVECSFEASFIAVYEPGGMELGGPAGAPAGEELELVMRAMTLVLGHRQLKVREHGTASAAGSLGVALLRHATRDYGGGHEIAALQVQQALAQEFPGLDLGQPLQPGGEAARWLMRHVMRAYGDGRPCGVVVVQPGPQGQPVVVHEEGPREQGVDGTIAIAAWGERFAAIENASGRTWQEHLAELAQPVTVAQQAQAIAQRLPRQQGESNAAWARRIHQADAQVQAMDYDRRIEVLAAVTQARPGNLRAEPALKDLGQDVAQQAQAIAQRLPRQQGESNAAWARRIHQADAQVQAMDYDRRIEVLAAVTQATPGQLRRDLAR